jgi:hypothetical protein
VGLGAVVLALLLGSDRLEASGGRSSLPPPALRPFQAWFSVTTGAGAKEGLAAVWAITARSNLAALAPFDFSTNLLHLSRNGIYLWATTAGRGGPNRTFRRSQWPLRLARFRIDHGWEGQPAPNVQQRLYWVAVRGWHLDLRIYFATQHPSRQLLRSAQQELDRLLLPGS